MVILFNLALAAPGQVPFAPRVPVPLSINGLAKMYSVSRKHVLTLLRDTEARQLLARGGKGNDEITILPRARDHVRNHVSVSGAMRRGRPAHERQAHRHGGLRFRAGTMGIVRDSRA